MSAEYKTLEDVCRGMELIHQQLKSRDQIEAERRKLDDARDSAARKDRSELLDRVNKHGTRQTALETRWEAFFGDQGAFKIVVKGMEQTTAKLNMIIWAGFVGTLGLLVELGLMVMKK